MTHHTTQRIGNPERGVTDRVYFGRVYFGDSALNSGSAGQGTLACEQLNALSPKLAA